MGIHGVNGLAKKEAPYAFRTIKPQAFAKRRIVFDGPLLSFSNYSVCYNHLLNSVNDTTTLLSDKLLLSKENRSKIMNAVKTRFRALISDMYSFQITPVFVFDGENFPEKTAGARARRALRRESTAARCSQLRSQISETDPLFRRPSDITALKALLKQRVPITPDDIKTIGEFIVSLGVPIYKAPDEAEKFCSFAAASGFAAAVWSTDTDTYCFGAPLIITDSTYLKGSLVFNVVVVPVILKSMGFTRRQFVDWCIMLECDFNTRMPGVGPVSSLEMMRQAQLEDPTSNMLIERAAAANPMLPWDMLNVDRCREIFIGIDGFEQALDDMRKKCSCVNIEAVTDPSNRSILKEIVDVVPIDVQFRCKNGLLTRPVFYDT